MPSILGQRLQGELDERDVQIPLFVERPVAFAIFNVTTHRARARTIGPHVGRIAHHVIKAGAKIQPQRRVLPPALDQLCHPHVVDQPVARSDEAPHLLGEREQCVGGIDVETGDGEDLVILHQIQHLHHQVDLGQEASEAVDV